MSAKDASVTLYDAVAFDGRLQRRGIEVYPLPRIRLFHCQGCDCRWSPFDSCMCKYLASCAHVDLPGSRAGFLNVELLAYLALKLSWLEQDIGV